MAWIESHQTLARHPKTKAVARDLNISRVTVVGHLHYLWWWALDYAEDGDLSGFSDDDIAEEAGWEGDADRFVLALRQSGFLSDDMRINDWSDYTGRLVAQREGNRERQRRFRDRHRDVTEPHPRAERDVTQANTVGNSDVTRDVTPRNGATVHNPTVPNQPNQTEPTQPTTGDTPPNPPATDDPPNPSVYDQRFDAFWAAYPKRTGKAAALRWWIKKKPSQEFTDMVLRALERQVVWPQWCRDGGQYIPNPTTWLSEGRWDDEQPANVTHMPNGRASPSGPRNLTDEDLERIARGESA